MDPILLPRVPPPAYHSRPPSYRSHDFTASSLPPYALGTIPPAGSIHSSASIHAAEGVPDPDLERGCGPAPPARSRRHRALVTLGEVTAIPLIFLIALVVGACLLLSCLAVLATALGVLTAVIWAPILIDMHIRGKL